MAFWACLQAPLQTLFKRRYIILLFHWSIDWSWIMLVSVYCAVVSAAADAGWWESEVTSDVVHIRMLITADSCRCQCDRTLSLACHLSICLSLVRHYLLLLGESSSTIQHFSLSFGCHSCICLYHWKYCYIQFSLFWQSETAILCLVRPIKSYIR